MSFVLHLHLRYNYPRLRNEAINWCSRCVYTSPHVLRATTDVDPEVDPYFYVTQYARVSRQLDVSESVNTENVRHPSSSPRLLSQWVYTYSMPLGHGRAFYVANGRLRGIATVG